ncbi:hypothetical protein EJ110_NYTH15943 [Nymphaea thermarum]|nr:hypothetical protein EJ110_NYTH15943 [Nymphaea thermarum]
MDKDTEILKLPISRPHIQAEAGLKIIGVTGLLFSLNFFSFVFLHHLVSSTDLFFSIDVIA